MNSDRDPFLKALQPFKVSELSPAPRRATHAHQNAATRPPLAVRNRRELREMNAVEIQQYLNAAGQMTQEIMPAGSRFVLAIASPGGRVDYITTLPDKVTAAVLRDLSAHIDAAVAEGWTPAEESGE